MSLRSGEMSKVIRVLKPMEVYTVRTYWFACCLVDGFRLGADSVGICRSD